MNFAAWQQLTPSQAAHEIHERVRTRLSPAQQRAVIAHLSPEAEIAGRLDRPRGSAPLVGVPYFAKDLFDVAGVPTLAGTTFLAEVRGVPQADGAMVRAMAQAGAALAGKTHLHECAYGITGENLHYGDCQHPHFPDRTTGGSSSGSVAIVAAGIVPLALGSDTGGSVRVPAAFTGLFGYRLTPGDPWIRDAFPLSTTFDTAGWFTANGRDMRTAIGALVGLRTSQREPRGCYLELPGIDPDVALACRDASRRLASPADSAVRDDLIHGFSPALETYHTIVSLEGWNTHKSWAERYRDRYSPVVWQRLNRAHSVSPAQIQAADLGLATIRMLWTKYFQTFDFLVLPASPGAAFTKAEYTQENRNRVLSLTAPASIGGLPVLTIPVPLPTGPTTGLQIVVNDPQSPVVNWALERWGN